MQHIEDDSPNQEPNEENLSRGDEDSLSLPSGYRNEQDGASDLERESRSQYFQEQASDHLEQAMYAQAIDSVEAFLDAAMARRAPVQELFGDAVIGGNGKILKIDLFPQGYERSDVVFQGAVIEVDASKLFSGILRFEKNTTLNKTDKEVEISVTMLSSDASNGSELPILYGEVAEYVAERVAEYVAEREVDQHQENISNWISERTAQLFVDHLSELNLEEIPNLDLYWQSSREGFGSADVSFLLGNSKIGIHQSNSLEGQELRSFVTLEADAREGGHHLMELKPQFTHALEQRLLSELSREGFESIRLTCQVHRTAETLKIVEEVRDCDSSDLRVKVIDRPSRGEEALGLIWEVELGDHAVRVDRVSALSHGDSESEVFSRLRAIYTSRHDPMVPDTYLYDEQAIEIIEAIKTRISPERGES